MLPTGEKVHTEEPLVPPCKAVLIHRSDEQERKAQGSATADQSSATSVTVGCHRQHIPAPWRHPSPSSRRAAQGARAHSPCWTLRGNQGKTIMGFAIHPAHQHITSDKGSPGPGSIWALLGSGRPTPLQPRSVGTAAASRAALQMLGICTAPSLDVNKFYWPLEVRDAVDSLSPPPPAAGCYSPT